MYSSRAEVTKLHKEYAHLQREFRETLRARGEEVVTPRVSIDNIRLFTRVMRGPDWYEGNQDGGEGSTGYVVGYLDENGVSA